MAIFKKGKADKQENNFIGAYAPMELVYYITLFSLVQGVSKNALMVDCLNTWMVDSIIKGITIIFR